MEKVKKKHKEKIIRNRGKKRGRKIERGRKVNKRDGERYTGSLATYVLS
jgi:hypothetical protein